MVPTMRTVWLTALGIPLVLLGLFGKTGLVAAGAYDLALLLAVALDRLMTGAPRDLGLERVAPGRWIQGRAESVTLRLRWGGRLRGRFRIRDLAPPGFSVTPDEHVAVLDPGQSALVTGRVVPFARGDHAFRATTIRACGPLGLVERRDLREIESGVRVYPNLLSLSAREAALVSPSVWRAGTRRGRVHGEGREFHQLREYAPGDDVRFVDWKAFAHRGRPAVREFRAERNQRILLLVDAGRMMTVRVGDRLRFDWAVQAAGRLARVAVAMGDAVGIAIYSRTVKARLPAARGAGQLGRIADLLADATPDLDEPDLGGAILEVLRGGFRRTLVVVLTEIADPRTAESVLVHVGGLAPRHLGLVVTLFDADLHSERRRAVRGADHAYLRTAADELWQESLRTESSLQARGALVVRARADALAAEAVERYVEIKRLGRL